jgi:hypothetical protein
MTFDREIEALEERLRDVEKWQARLKEIEVSVIPLFFLVPGEDADGSSPLHYRASLRSLKANRCASLWLA